MHFFLESLVLVLLLVPGVRASAYSVTCDDFTNPATCYGVCELKKDECHCVRENSNKKCPEKPKVGYEQDIIDALKLQQARNPTTLVNGCNPFFDPTCQTNPPLADVSQNESTEGSKKGGKNAKNMMCQSAVSNMMKLMALQDGVFVESQLKRLTGTSCLLYSSHLREFGRGLS